MTDTNIELGSTSVFADLGLPDATDRQTKTHLALARAPDRIIKDRAFKQADAARMLGVSRP